MSVTVSSQLSVAKLATASILAFAIMGGTLAGCDNKDKEKRQQERAERQELKQELREERKAERQERREEAQAKKQEQKAAANEAPKKAKAPACGTCGVIAAIKPVEVEGEATGAGAITGAVAGAVIGNQVSSDKDKRRMAQVVGVAGGAVAGHAIEKAANKETHFRITVNMDNGSQQTITQKSKKGLSQGARVRIQNGAVVPE